MPHRSLVRETAEQLSQRLAQIDATLSNKKTDRSSQSLVRSALDDALWRLSPLDCSHAEQRLLSASLWQIAGDFLRRGSLQYHARTKPRGYAGDFDLLDKIHRCVCSDDPLGFAMDRYFQEQAAPNAVRQRSEQTARAIVDYCLKVQGPVAVAGVGCGPATEIGDACRALPRQRRDQLSAVLLDIDPEALQFAEQRLSPWMAGRLICERINVARPDRNKKWAQLREQFHLIYCPGVLDYLEVEAATRLIRVMWQWLKPGGTLTVYNFAPENPSRAYMEWIGDWYLLYRDVDEMSRLLEASIPQGCDSAVTPVASGAAVEARIVKPLGRAGDAERR